jgi:predicted aspartyl protease
MKNKSFTRVALKLVLFYSILAAGCAGIQAQVKTELAPQSPQTPLRFRSVQGTLIVVSVRANGDGPFDFLLDTGAENSIVDPVIATRLSLVTLKQIQQITLTGNQMVPVSVLASLELGQARVAGLPVLIQNLATLRKMDSKLVGIVGQDFLSHFNYLVDYHARALHFDVAGTIQNHLSGDRVPFEGGRKRMMITAHSYARQAGQAKVALVIDSGATSMVLLGTASLQVEPHAPSMAMRTELQTTSSGQSGVRVGEVHTLEIGSQQFHDVPAAQSSRPSAELAQDGLLPMSLFRSVYVNNRDGYVILNPHSGNK